MKRFQNIPAEKIAEFLVKSGLLFEINRKVLHPRGLALAVEAVDQSNTSDSPNPEPFFRFSSIQDERVSDNRGRWFSRRAFENGLKKLEKFDKANGQVQREAVRFEKLGWIAQVSSEVLQSDSKTEPHTEGGD